MHQNMQTASAAAAAIPRPGAWRRDDIRGEDWIVPLGPKAQDEIGRFLRAYRHAPVPLYLIDPRDHALDHCRAAMDRARQILRNGVGFALIDRIDLDSMTADEGRAVYWLISNLLSRPVAQSLNGTILHDVRDYGTRAEPGAKVRPNATNQDISIHNDNSFNPLMPDYVGLLCVRPAKSGGISRVMHLDQVYTLLQQHYPETLSRMFEPFWLFRNGQHAPDEAPVIAEPIFKVQDGRLTARFSIHMMLGGYKHKGEPIDARTRAAIDAIEAVFAMEDYQFDFAMERGQIQYVQNLQIGHSRTEFEDHDDPELKRNLVRIWMRDSGGRSYVG